MTDAARRQGRVPFRLMLSLLGAATTLGSVPTYAATHSNCRPTESWHQVGVDTFVLPEAGERSQGVTSDGTSWFFSWKFGLEHATDGYLATANNPMAIPPALLRRGSDHIGDIDYYRHRLVIPIEDGSTGYQHPYLALVNATTLRVSSYDAVPRTLQTEGVPWVAVDAARGIAYTAEWNDATQINMFDIEHHFSYLGAIPLQQPISRIQGAKLYDGNLLASVDDTAKTVYRINLTDGSVTRLFSLNETGELEGLAVRPTRDGAILHVMMMIGSPEQPAGYRGEFHHYARTVASPCAHATAVAATAR